MHPCPRDWVTIGCAVVYYARAAHAISAGIKCCHCISSIMSKYLLSTSNVIMKDICILTDAIFSYFIATIRSENLMLCLLNPLSSSDVCLWFMVHSFYSLYFYIVLSIMSCLFIFLSDHVRSATPELLSLRNSTEGSDPDSSRTGVESFTTSVTLTTTAWCPADQVVCKSGQRCCTCSGPCLIPERGWVDPACYQKEDCDIGGSVTQLSQEIYADVDPDRVIVDKYKCIILI